MIGKWKGRAHKGFDSQASLLPFSPLLSFILPLSKSSPPPPPLLSLSSQPSLPASQAERTVQDIKGVLYSSSIMEPGIHSPPLRWKRLEFSRTPGPSLSFVTFYTRPLWGQDMNILLTVGGLIGSTAMVWFHEGSLVWRTTTPALRRGRHQLSIDRRRRRRADFISLTEHGGWSCSSLVTVTRL